MKVCQEIDVDNVTIVINPQNKLEAIIPKSSGSVEIEEINASLAFTFDQGLVVYRNDTNTNHPLTKLGRIKGTDWLVVRAKDVFGDVEPVPKYDTSWHLSWTASGDDEGTVTYIKDGNNIVGATTTISFTRKLHVGMSFDVHFEFNGQPVKTVNVVSEGQSQFTVTTGVTDFRFDNSTGGTPSGSIYIDNVKNNVANREMYTIDYGNVNWVGMLGRD